MIERQKRLHEVFEHLRKHFGIHTQTDFAEAIKYSRIYISSAMNGNEKNLTDKLFKNICKAYPGIFRIEYLLHGEGDLLTVEEDVKSKDAIYAATSTESDEQTANILELYAQRVRLVDDLRVTLQKELDEVRTVKSELQQARIELQQSSEQFRDATRRLTQALRAILPSSSIHYDAVAEQPNVSLNT